MSSEAIQKVAEAEQAARERRAGAAEEAKRIVAGAERAGRQLVQDQRARAEQEARSMLAEAEAQAEKKAEQTLADNAAQCEALKQAARRNLDKAAALIVGRVGNS